MKKQFKILLSVLILILISCKKQISFNQTDQNKLYYYILLVDKDKYSSIKSISIKDSDSNSYMVNNSFYSSKKLFIKTILKNNKENIDLIIKLYRADVLISMLSIVRNDQVEIDTIFHMDFDPVINDYNVTYYNKVSLIESAKTQISDIKYGYSSNIIGSGEQKIKFTTRTKTDTLKPALKFTSYQCGLKFGLDFIVKLNNNDIRQFYVYNHHKIKIISINSAIYLWHYY